MDTKAFLEEKSAQMSKGEYQNNDSYDNSSVGLSKLNDLLDKLFDNSGRKLRKVTKVIMIILGVLSIPTIIGPLLIYILYLPLYAFAEMAENVAIIAKNTAPKNQEEITQETK